MSQLPLRDDALPPTPPGDRYALVAVERGFDAGTGGEGLTYAVGPRDVSPGDRVVVPLGRRARGAPGVVTTIGGAELLAGLDPSRVKTISEVSPARLPPRLLDLAKWIAAYYVTPLGMVLAAMTPAAVRRGTSLRRTATYVHGSSAPGTRGRDARAWSMIEQVAEGDWPMTAPALAERLGFRTPAPIRRLVVLGLLRPGPLVGPGGSAPPGWTPECAPTLTDEQSRVVESVRPDLGTFAVHLVRGVTGSGKTEIYLRLIEEVLARGRTAIVLVPEIALTPQTVGRFQSRLGPRVVGVQHSGLSAGRRAEFWAGAAEGRTRVVIGARSAVFAPMAGVGLIVVDEEHDASYKQDQLPRYHARDVAIKRAQLEGCPAVLGSATPSLESWRNASVGSRHWRRHALESRATGAALPRVEVVDMSDNELAKMHVRYMVGGHAPRAADEVLYRFEFPERSGALLHFLSRMGDRWNISLFHYRNHGAAYGRVLMGIQVPPAERAEFSAFLGALDLDYTEETDNPAYRMFLR